eukprot:scaffold15910_cov193-Amphora_coffeaeformis.AAC.14
MAQPETQIKTKTKIETQTKQKVEIRKQEKTHDPISRREDDFQDAPMFKVMLLEDNGAWIDERLGLLITADVRRRTRLLTLTHHVSSSMTAIMEDLDEDAAATVFQQAMQEGKAMCGKYPFEVAELYKEQLLRSDPMIFADIEDENA